VTIIVTIIVIVVVGGGNAISFSFAAILNHNHHLFDIIDWLLL
jgi:C4-dicarboxylate transporter